MSRTAFSCQVTTIWADGTIERDGVPLRDWKPPTLTTAEWTRSITDASSRPNVAAQQIAAKQAEIRRSLAQPKTAPMAPEVPARAVSAPSKPAETPVAPPVRRSAPPRLRQAPLRPAAEPDLFGA